MKPFCRSAIRCAPLAFVLIGAGLALPAAAACIGTVPAAPGMMKGGISGYDACDFLVTLKAGQVLAPKLEAPEGFLLLSVGDVEHDFAKGPLTAPQDGTYTVRVRQTRTVARKHPEIRRFIIDFGDAEAVPPSPSAKASVPVTTD